MLKRVSGDIVVYNELLCFSAEGRRIEMLTVTDNHGADKREEDLLYDHADVASTTHLFPEVGTARPRGRLGIQKSRGYYQCEGAPRRDAGRRSC